MSTLTPEQMDAFTISVEQEIENDDYTPSSFTQPLLASLANLDPAEKQEEYVRIAADLAYAFSGAMREDQEQKAARLEAERVAEALRLKKEREEAERVAEERARLRREERQRNNPYAGQTPACGLLGCTLPQCYDGTYSNAINRVSGWGDSNSDPLNDIRRTYERLRYSAQDAYYAYDGSRNIGYADGMLGRYITAPTMDPEPLPEWEQQFLSGGRLYIAPLDTPAPEGDPVLGTQGL